jgi:hypothetical protein
MTPQILNPESFSVKVISIDSSTLLDKTIAILKGFESYKDQHLNEHLYTCTVLEDITQVDFLSLNVEKELMAIQELCNQNDASYFRLISTK